MPDQIVGDDGAGLYVDTDLSAPWFASDGDGLYFDLDLAPAEAAGADAGGAWLAEFFVSVQEWIDAAFSVSVAPKLDLEVSVVPSMDLSVGIEPKLTLAVTILGGGGSPGG